MKFNNPFERNKPNRHIPTVEEFKKTFHDSTGLLERTFSQTEVDELWEDLNEVGKTKAIGYLPISTLVYACGVTDLKQLERSYRDKGLKTKFQFYENDKSKNGPGEIFNLTVWDEAMLQKLLDQNVEILKKHQWPLKASDFIDKINTEIAESQDLYELVARAYNDKRYR